MTDREALQQIADIANAQLAGQASSPSSGVPPVTTKPAPSIDLGTGDTANPGVPAGPNQVIGAAFTVIAGTARTLSVYGQPGNFQKASWAIFDSGGGIVFSATNIDVFNGLLLDPGMLGQLQAGTYVLGVAQNLALPKLSFYFAQ